MAIRPTNFLLATPEFRLHCPLVPTLIKPLVDNFSLRYSKFKLWFKYSIILKGDEGYYALCNGKLLKKLTDKCTLRQNINLNTQVYLQFWYFQYGLQIGTLQLIVNDAQIIWEMSGKQKNEWLFANISIPADAFVVRLPSLTIIQSEKLLQNYHQK